MGHPFPSIPEVGVVLGCKGSGKTTALVDRAAALVDGGVPPESVRVFAATPLAARALNRVLHERLGEAAPQAMTSRQAALALLGSGEARVFTGRSPRMLLPHEEAFLFEDLRVTGTKEKRLREMTKFFARQWTELADDDPSWLLEGEETVVHGHLKACLAFLGGVAEPEIANFAVRYLDAYSTTRARAAAAYVLVDDFGLLSRASQVLCALLATEALFVAMDPFMVDRAFESFPYAAGAAELVAANPHAHVERLRTLRQAAPIAQTVQELLGVKVQSPTMDEEMLARSPLAVPAVTTLWGDEAPEALPACEGVVSAPAFGMPTDEMEGVAAAVAEACAAGAAPREVAVVCFRDASVAPVMAALAERGVSAASLVSERPLRADVRDPEACGVARQFALLALAADGTCALDWRTMGGFGDSLGRSLAFKALREYGTEHGLGLAALLEEANTVLPSLPEETRPTVAQVVAVYRQVQPVLAKLTPLRGRALIDAVARVTVRDEAAPEAVAFRALVGPIGEDDDAFALFSRLMERLSAPTFDADGDGAQTDAVADDDGAVAVVSARDAATLDARVVVVSDVVNGFVPPRRFFDRTATVQHEAEKLWSASARRLYATVAAAAEQLTLCSFTRMEPAEAQRADVQVGRVRAEDGCRVCCCNPSVFLDLICPNAGR